MRKQLMFVKISSIAVKVVAWLVLCAGFIVGFSILFGKVPEQPRWIGPLILVFYCFSFFFLYLIAKIADLVTIIFRELHKE